MAEQVAKIYEPKSIEAKASEIWLAGNFFHADAAAASAKGSYTIVIPPPNVTAALHLGHALNNTLQDILIRFRRMQQFNTLWMPGTDHAGIATQTVVEKRLLAEEGKRRTDYQRDAFVARVQAWKDEYEGQILGQLKSMGCSCDWERTRFTMDEVCAKAVRTNFFNLFKDGLIYRGKRLVNWDPATQTVLADDEVEHETVHGHFWYLRYPLVESVEIDGRTIEHVTVATTRPETMLGDTAVAMNPSDPRAKALVGKKVRLPIVGREIPIVADEHVVLPNPESDDEKAKFSTGYLKVTPAHDPDDYAIGERHYGEIADAILPQDFGGDPRQYVFLNVMAPDGSISHNFGWADWEHVKNPDVENLIGMDRFEARAAIVEWFRGEKLLGEVRDYSHEVGHSYRSHVPIEPYLSDQWYVEVKKPIKHLGEKLGEGLIAGTDVPVNSLAGLALKPLLDGRLRFVPERYAKTYQTWLENLRDWPISRQLWWGHQIPVWSKLGGGGQLRNELSKAPDKVDFEHTDSDQGPITYCSLAPGNEDIEARLQADGWTRDADVLDTWFSSALWPFSTLGWPDDVPEMKAFYPGDVLCTAREIITLWVSRMVMMGQYCAGDIPFKDVYIHAMIQDGQGRKMSKSLGNGIDPLVAIDSHGADAMRFTLASMTTDTQDIRMPVAPMELPDGRTVNTSPKFDVGRNFCNKLWNASRFAMMNLEGTDPEKFDVEKMDLTDKWILSRLTRTIIEVSEDLEQFKYNEPLNAIYRFFWNDLCDWYLEWVKPRIQDAGGTAFQAVDVAGIDERPGKHGQDARATAQNILAFALDQTLRLLHPFIPFITEGIFQNLNSIAPVRKLNGLADAPAAEAIIVAQWPEAVRSLIDEQAEQQISTVQNCIRAIREIRSKYNIVPSQKLNASAKALQAAADILNRNADLIGNLCGIEQFTAATDIEKSKDSAAAIIKDVQIYVHGVIDPQAERKRLEKKKQQLENGIKPLQGKLGNENFVTRAKPEVVEQAKRRLKELTEQLETVDKHLAEL